MAKYKKKKSPFMTVVKVVVIIMFVIMIVMTVGQMIIQLPIWH